MTTPQTTAAPPVSLAEYAALPKHPRYELVQGVLAALPMVESQEHEYTVVLVGSHLLGYVDANGLGEIYGSNRGYVTVPASPATVRMTDVSFVSTERLVRAELAGMLYNGAPDLAVEIRSEGNTAAEMAQKVSEYLGAGSKAVWVIDLDARTLTVHTPGTPPVTLTDADVVDGGDYLPGFTCAVADLLPAVAV